MDETLQELEQLQALIDRSFAGAGDHLKAIVRPERRLSAPQVCAYLQGVKHITVATVTERGHPRVAPVDGVFWHGFFHFSTAQSSVRARHLAVRPAVAVAHVVGDEIAMWTYGRAETVKPGGRVWDAFEARWREIYGSAASDWAPDPVYVRVVPDRFFAYAFDASRWPDEPEPVGTHDDVAEADATRVEHDTMGEVRVPAQALYGAQTQRAVENFPISGERVPAELVHAIAQVKEAAARTNARLGILSEDVADAVARASAAVAAGEADDQFPIDVFQTGSGTSTNMNVNEVVATLAARALQRPVHPNDVVNASQSSNDVFPSAIHVAALASTGRDLLPALDHLAETFARKAEDTADVVKAGRTHLMDAVPVTLGQELSGYAAQIRTSAERIGSSLPRVAELPLGGTAVGTGLNTPSGWRTAVVAELASLTGLPLTPARDGFEAQSARDSLVELSGQLRTTAVALTKICNDLRWMGSGPRAGLGEIRIPDLQPGSSIMPGKVNPVVPEAVLQVCAQVVGNDAAIAWGGAAGTFELNVMLPVVARNLLSSISLLANGSRLLADRCVAGIEPESEHLRELAESSPSIVTPLNKYLGYEEAAAVAKQALRERKTIREVVLERGHVREGRLTEQQLDEALDVDRMARGQE
jgi:fumarate hydratase class II